MAVVRFSEELRSNIICKAESLHDTKIMVIRDEYESKNWGERIAETLIPTDLREQLDNLPAGVVSKTRNLRFGGFYSPKDAEVSVEAEVMEVQRRFPHNVIQFTLPEKYSFLPYEFADASNAELMDKLNCRRDTVGYQQCYRFAYNDPRYTDIYEEYKDIADRHHVAVEAKNKFVHGVKKLINHHTTLNPALRAWPALWDLLPDDAKARHKKVTPKRNRTAKEIKEELDVDLDSLTTTVTIAKLTK